MRAPFWRLRSDSFTSKQALHAQQMPVQIIDRFTVFMDPNARRQSRSDSWQDCSLADIPAPYQSTKPQKLVSIAQEYLVSATDCNLHIISLGGGESAWYSADCQITSVLCLRVLHSIHIVFIGTTSGQILMIDTKCTLLQQAHPHDSPILGLKFQNDRIIAVYETACFIIEHECVHMISRGMESSLVLTQLHLGHDVTDVVSVPSRASLRNFPYFDLEGRAYQDQYMTVGTPLLTVYGVERPAPKQQSVFTIAKSFWKETAKHARLFSLGEPQRSGLKVLAEGSLAAVSDTLGRISLVDLRVGEILRMWKGVKDAQFGWISGSTPHLAIYSSSRGSLEIYSMAHASRVALLQVVSGGLLTKCSDVLGSKAALQTVYCPLYLIDSHGAVGEIVVTSEPERTKSMQIVRLIDDACLAINDAVREKLLSAAIESASTCDAQAYLSVICNLPRF